MRELIRREELHVPTSMHNTDESRRCHETTQRLQVPQKVVVRRRSSRFLQAVLTILLVLLGLMVILTWLGLNALDHISASVNGLSQQAANNTSQLVGIRLELARLATALQLELSRISAWLAQIAQSLQHA